MVQFRSVTTNIPMGAVVMQEEVTRGNPQTTLTAASSLAVHTAPSYGSTRIDFEWRESDTHGWRRMSGQDVIVRLLRELNE